MSRALILFALLLAAACSRDSGAPATDSSPCRHERFEQARFIVCTPPAPQRLTLFAAARGEMPRRRFRDLGLDEGRVAFAMNAGMFGTDGRAIGLAVVDGRPVHRIALRASGGNFGMKPNGVFLVRASGQAQVVVSEAYRPAPDITLATQSGPMLVIDGKVHPSFAPDGASRTVRNGVGIGPGGGPLFVIAEDPVSLGKLARFFRDRLHSRDALYFDGSVSSLWSPADDRMDDFTDLGPIIVALK